MSKFNINKTFLEQKLFDNIRPKNGVKTILNMSVLPDYLTYLKTHLTQQQKLLLSEYHLQNLLMEYSVHGNKVINTKLDSQTSNLQQLTNQLLEYIRHKKEFWLKKVNCSDEKQKQHQAIEEFNKHLDYANKNITISKSNDYYSHHSINKKIYHEYSFWKYPYSQTLISNNNKIIVTIYPYIIQYVQKNTHLQLQCQNLSKQQNVQIRKQQDNSSLIKQHPSSVNTLTLQQKKILQNCLIYFTFKTKSYKSSQQIYLPIKTTTMTNFTLWFSKYNNINRIFNNTKQYIFLSNIIEILFSIKSIFNTHKNYSDKKLTIQNLQIDRKILDEEQIYIIAKQFKNLYQVQIKKHTEQANNAQQQSKKTTNPQQNPNQSYLYHFDQQSIFIPPFKHQYQQLINHPKNINLQNYKVTGSQVPWQDKYYQVFLNCLKEFFLLPTNNRKIALQMSKKLNTNIQPNHVKHIKGIYLRNMNKRIDNGQLGGGKRGRVISKQDFLSKDIETFNMRYFRQISKEARKKRIKKRKQTSSESDSIENNTPVQQ